MHLPPWVFSKIGHLMQSIMRIMDLNLVSFRPVSCGELTKNRVRQKIIYESKYEWNKLRLYLCRFLGSTSTHLIDLVVKVSSETVWNHPYTIKTCLNKSCWRRMHWRRIWHRHVREESQCRWRASSWMKDLHKEIKKDPQTRQSGLNRINWDFKRASNLFQMTGLHLWQGALQCWNQAEDSQWLASLTKTARYGKKVKLSTFR